MVQSTVLVSMYDDVFATMHLVATIMENGQWVALLNDTSYVIMKKHW